jgi:hypothetical protein
VSENIERIKLANNKYAKEFGNKSDLEIPPERTRWAKRCGEGFDKAISEVQFFLQNRCQVIL